MTLDLTSDSVEGRLEEEDAAEGPSLSERGFLMAAEDTRHIWDTPEEDEAWAHLQSIPLAGSP
jgi:hypothetical protein